MVGIALVLMLTTPAAAPALAQAPSIEDRQAWSIQEAREHTDELGFKSQTSTLVPAREVTTTREPAQAGPQDTKVDAVPVQLPDPGATNLVVPSPGAGKPTTGRAGGLKVALARADKQPTAVGEVLVRNQDAVAARELGAAGPLISLTPTANGDGGDVAAHDGAGKPMADAGGRVTVSLDVSYLQDADDLLHRLTLQTFPECSLTAPKRTECRVGQPAHDVKFDPAAMTISGTVLLPAVDPKVASSGMSTLSTDSVAMALMSTTSGTSGDWGATSLAPSAAWNVSTQSGAFTWSYPMRSPSVPGGLTPDLSLSYSSASLDGRVASTNNQSSVVGDGWEPSFSGYIERKYVPCTDDQSDVGGKAANNASYDSGDLCWKSNNATLMFNGSATELVRDGATDTWRPKNDDNSVITHATGGWNTDNDTEYWTLTTADGTKYWFGRDKRSATDTALGSSWVTQVYGNHPGEPCYQAAFKDSDCKQTWRWNLDYVQDTSGNTMTYRYAKQNNNYGYENNTDTLAYTRSGWLTSIEYGTRAGDLTTAAPAKVVFNYAERCIATSSFDCADTKLNATNKGYWPDVPQDLICTSSTTCPNVTSPVFFDRKRLTNVTTQVRVGGTYVSADTWDLTQSLPQPGDGSNATLRLEKVLHTGRNGAVADKALPAVQFAYTQLENRVDKTGDAGSAMTRYRLTQITSESGGITSVTYSGRECSPSNLPSSPQSNTMRCQPVWWTPDGDAGQIMEYFHHYRVATVVDDPRLAGTAPIETNYAYTGGPAWHYDDNQLVRPKYRTWSQLRGYSTVDVYIGATGDPSAPRLRTTYRYFRGMYGDKDGSGGTRDDKVDGINDLDQYAGMLREQIIHNGSNEVSSTVSVPWRSDVTAADPQDTSLKAYHTGVSETVSTTVAPKAPGGQQTTRTTTEFDAYGMPVKISDLGDTTKTGDETCTTTTYLRNTAKNILASVQRAETLGTSCADATGASRPADVVSDQRYAYDGQAMGTAPSVGNTTLRQEADSYVSGAPKYVDVEKATYNSYGQQLTSTDALNRTTTTTYDNTGGLTVKVTTTSPDPDGSGSLTAHVASTVLDPVFGVATKATDANSKVTTGTYDGLGRLISVWAPGRVQGTDTATTIYAYTVSSTGANAVVTKTLNYDASAYVSSSVIYDALLRTRQTQSPTASAATAGRVISESMYDARGLPTLTRDGWATSGTASATLLTTPNAVDSRTTTTFDGAGRPVSELFQVGDGEKPDDGTSYLPRWTTTTTYEGDRVSVNPPAGGVPTTTISDARGNNFSLLQYTGDAPSGTHHDTTYSYDAADRLIGVSDPKGNKWTYRFDLRGRQVATTDPDKGDASTTYDAVGNVATSTDARGETLAYTYDALGRQTALRDDTSTGPVRARWVYDTKAKGYVTSSTRVDGTDEYTTSVGGYTDQYLPTAQTITLPASLGKAAGSYTYSYDYTEDGRVWGQELPTVAGLASEYVSTLFSATNAADGLSGGYGWGNYVTRADYLPTGEVSYLRTGSTFAYQQAMYYETGTRRLDAVTTTQQRDDPNDPLHEIHHATFDYDEAGNLLSAKDAPELGGQPKDQQCFDYDWAQRLTEAWTPTDGDCSAAPSAAALGGVSPYWKSYSYDVLGNRTSSVLHRSASQGGDVTSTYTRSVSGATSTRPHAVTSVTAKDAAGAALGTSSYSYDDAGNMTARTIAGEEAQTLTWDAEGELAGVSADEDADGAVEPAEKDGYVYTADGDRLVRRQGGTTTVYLPGQELTISATGIPSATRYYTFAGKTVATRTGNEFDKISSIFSDQHNTGIVQISNVANAITRRYLDPFGDKRTGAPGAPEDATGTTGWVGDRGFLDKPADDTGLTQIGARYYDPTLGTFISVDPVMDLADPQQWNAYAYANNNPTSLSDPSGLIPMGAGHVGYNPNQKNDPRKYDNCTHAISCVKTVREEGTGNAVKVRVNFTDQADAYFADNPEKSYADTTISKAHTHDESRARAKADAERRRSQEEADKRNLLAAEQRNSNLDNAETYLGFAASALGLLTPICPVCGVVSVGITVGLAIYDIATGDTAGAITNGVSALTFGAGGVLLRSSRLALNSGKGVWAARNAARARGLDHLPVREATLRFRKVEATSVALRRGAGHADAAFGPYGVGTSATTAASAAVGLHTAISERP